MNIRKTVDYSTMYQKLTAILTQNLSQMDEIYAIGKTISQRPEKGAAVAAAEFLQANFPDRTGFSPRNMRRMRDFYRTYENDKTLLRVAMKIGWTLNVVIMEAELTRAARKWYLEQARAQQWSKTALLEKLASTAHLEKPLEAEADTCYTDKKAEDEMWQPVAAVLQRCWIISPFHKIAALLQDLTICVQQRPCQRTLHARC
jgi:predicted nuclease of restriction endonuclease-like (RecB) superfamily